MNLYRLLAQRAADNKGTILTWSDVVVTDSEIVRVRREMESLFAAEWGLRRHGAITVA